MIFFFSMNMPPPFPLIKNIMQSSYKALRIFYFLFLCIYSPLNISNAHYILLNSFANIVFHNKVFKVLKYHMPFTFTHGNYWNFLKNHNNCVMLFLKRNPFIFLYTTQFIKTTLSFLKYVYKKKRLIYCTPLLYILKNDYFSSIFKSLKLALVMHFSSLKITLIFFLN